VNLLKKFLVSCLAMLLLMEELLWHILTYIGRYLSQLLLLKQFEIWLSEASPVIAMLAFIIPIALISPLNLVALHFLAKGKVVTAIIVELSAKLLATLIIARVFAITKPKLLQFKWFAALYSTITRWLAWAHRIIEQNKIYLLAQSIKQHIPLYTATLKQFFRKFYP